MRTVLIVGVCVALAGCQPKAQVNVSANAPPPAQKVEEPAQIQPLEAVTAEPPARTDKPAPVEPARAPLAAEATTQPEAPFGMIAHTVTKSDTLWSLSKQYLGDPRRWQEIVKANPGLNPSQLKVGQRILIPKK